jgi:uracil-DNA glycosylase family 4
MTQPRTPMAALQTSIRSCTRCVDAGFIPSAAPILRGNAAAKLMVIGQAPGPTAAERPWPYSGATGKTLNLWLVSAGFDADALHNPDRFYLTSLTKCFPGKARSGAGDRVPGRTEIELCADHLNAELATVQPDLILALGRLSINRLLPSTRRSPLREVVGTILRSEYPPAGAAQVLGLPHPSGVSRWLNSQANRQRLTAALSLLSDARERQNW